MLRTAVNIATARVTASTTATVLSQH